MSQHLGLQAIAQSTKGPKPKGPKAVAILKGTAPSLDDVTATLILDIREGDQSWRETVIDRYIAFLGGHVVSCSMRIATLRAIPNTAATRVQVEASKVQYMRAINFLRAAKAANVVPHDLETMELRLRANAWVEQSVQKVTQ